jgi:ABC-type uncharacterized transport system ATPase subunit
MKKIENKVAEDLIILETTWVAGEIKHKGDVVTVANNDKIQLLFTEKAVRKTEATKEQIAFVQERLDAIKKAEAKSK